MQVGPAPLHRPMPLWRNCRTRSWAQPMRPTQLKSLRPSLQSRNSPQEPEGAPDNRRTVCRVADKTERIPV